MTPTSHPPRLGAVGFSLAVALAGLLLPPAIQAHEIGTTRVVATFADDDTYAVAVVADASAVLGRLELAARRPLSSLVTAAEYQHAFDGLCGSITRHLSISFDGVASAPRATCVVDAAALDPGNPFDVPGVTVTLRGAMPRGARTFEWHYGLTVASYALTMISPDRQTDRTTWIEGGADSGALALVRAVAAPSRISVARTYLALGFTHILPKGLDHILFVLGLFLLSRRLRPMLWQVSAFTLAHTITLGLTLYGVLDLPSSVVEPLIALSIVYVAVENLFTSELRPWRVALVFGFGLLHGMGFAGVLRELTLPESEFLTALVSFNVGVEAGQLVVLGGAFAALGIWTARAESYRRFVVVPGSAAIALAGLFWTVERLMA